MSIQGGKPVPVHYLVCFKNLMEKEESFTYSLALALGFSGNVHVWHVVQVSKKLCFAQSSGLSNNVKHILCGKTLVALVFFRAVASSRTHTSADHLQNCYKTYRARQDSWIIDLAKKTKVIEARGRQRETLRGSQNEIWKLAMRTCSLTAPLGKGTMRQVRNDTKLKKNESSVVRHSKLCKRYP